MKGKMEKSSKDPLDHFLVQMKQAKLEAFLIVCGLIFVAAGAIFFFYQNKDESDNSIQILSEETQNSSQKVVVDVSGAVNAPKVVSLEGDLRIADAINAAGGLSAEADANFISKNLNLAAKLTDGAKIYIPFKGESQSIKGITSDKSITGITGLININIAGSAELESLSGIGPKTAAKIISNRPYSAIEELVSKKVLGLATFEKIKDQLTAF